MWALSVTGLLVLFATGLWYPVLMIGIAEAVRGDRCRDVPFMHRA